MLTGLLNSCEYVDYRVTIAKDRDTRQSRGVAFVLFVEKEAAQKAIQDMNNTQVDPLS